MAHRGGVANPFVVAPVIITSRHDEGAALDGPDDVTAEILAHADR